MRKQDKLKKMNKLSAKAINALRQKVTKFNKDEFANDIDQFRAVSCATTLLACTAYSMRFCCRPACGMFLMKGVLLTYYLLVGFLASRMSLCMAAEPRVVFGLICGRVGFREREERLRGLGILGRRGARQGPCQEGGEAGCIR